jgi:hypothetical protein
MKYYVVISGGEGDKNVDVLEKEELEKRLNDGDWYGYDDKPLNFLTLEAARHVDYWDYGDILVIEAEAVFPEKKEIVTKWEV